MPLYDYHCDKCDVFQEEFRLVNKRDSRPTHSCGTKMDRVLTAPNITGGTLSQNAFKDYRTAFGKSVDSWNNIKDMERHIEAKNKEWGINIEPLGNK